MINNFENLTGGLTYRLKNLKTQRKMFTKVETTRGEKKTSGWWLQEA